MKTQELAHLVLKMLDLQQEYFKTRSGTALRISKDAERRLRKVCEDILNPPSPGLFDDGANKA